MELQAIYEMMGLIPNYLVMNDNGDYDIDPSQMNVQIDINSVWVKEEKPSITIINKILNNPWEIKNNEKAEMSFFIEYYITKDMKHPEVKTPSGLSISKSMFYVLTTKVCAHFVETEFLKWIVEKKEMLGIMETDMIDAQKNNAHGIVLPACRIHELEQAYLNSEVKRQAIHKRLNTLRK